MLTYLNLFMKSFLGYQNTAYYKFIGILLCMKLLYYRANPEVQNLFLF